MTTYKLKSLNEFTDALDMCVDIEFFLYGTRYNISWQEKPFICTCPDGDAVFFNSAADLLANYKINNKPLQEIWKDIEIYSM